MRPNSLNEPKSTLSIRTAPVRPADELNARPGALPHHGVAPAREYLGTGRLPAVLLLWLTETLLCGALIHRLLIASARPSTTAAACDALVLTLLCGMLS